VARNSTRPHDAKGIELTPLERQVADDGIRYRHVTAGYDRELGLVKITVHASTDENWPLTVARELDDLILRLRTNETELGTWVFTTAGDPDAVLAQEHRLLADDSWLGNEIRHYYKRVLKRLDVTSRSLIALIEPGSCFVGMLLELAFACDRQYILDGPPIDHEDSDERASIQLTPANFGPFPMGNGITRLQSRFYGEDVDRLSELDKPVDAVEAADLGLVTEAFDDIDWVDEIRIVLEGRASLSPDALTGMEANHRFVGPETMETKIFARLAAWQNWIFNRPNAAGPDGALRRYGTGQKPVFDRKRV
jgi:benzoyl-CoA-dihydrodiol lyase